MRARLQKESISLCSSVGQSRAADAKVFSYVMDVRSSKSVVKAIHVFSKTVGEDMIAALVNSAAVVLPGSLMYTDLARIEACYDVNAAGTLRTTRAVVPGMRKLVRTRSFTPRIINLSSGAGRVPVALHGPYCMSKHAVEVYVVWPKHP